MLFIIALLAFISITLLVIILLPMSILPGATAQDEDDEPGGFMYQLKPLLSQMARLNARIDMPIYKSNLEKILTAAGDPFGIKLNGDEFIAFSQLCGFGGAFMVGLLFGFSPVSIVTGLLFGYYLPYLQANSARKERQHSIQRQIPDFLDLLTLSVEAGLDFNAGIMKLVNSARPTPLIEEFRLMIQEIKLGTTRYDALKAMATRVDIPDFTNFVSALLQTDRLGSNLGPTLRIQSDQMRTRRMQLAEEAGGKASVKLLLPLMVFILPAVFIMILGPIVVPLIF